MDTTKWATLLKAAPLASQLHGGIIFEKALNEEILKKDVKEMTQDEAERVISSLTQRNLIRLIKRFNSRIFDIVVVKTRPKMLKFLKNVTTSACIAAFEGDWGQTCLYGVKIPKEVILILLQSPEFKKGSKNGCLLRYIDAELIDDDIAEAALAENKIAICWVKKPTRKMIEGSLEKDNRTGVEYLVRNNLLNKEQLKTAIGLVPPAIEYVKDLTPELVVHAITHGLHTLPIKLTFKIPEEFEKVLITDNCDNIESLFEPSEETMSYAVNKNPYLISKSDKYPFMLLERAQEAAVAGHPEIIFSIKNPSDKVIQTAIRKNPYIVAHYRENEYKIFKSEHIMAAIKQEPKVLNALDIVPDEVQVDIIKESPEKIRQIKKPSKEAICLYISLVSGNSIINPDIDLDVPDALSKYFK